MTQQIPNWLLNEGQRLPMQDDPLKAYFEGDSRRSIQNFGVCTGCWRGYIATFTIEAGQLLLLDVLTVDEFIAQGSVSDTWIGNHPSATKLFPDSEGPVLATWFTGDLCIPLGPLEPEQRPEHLRDWAQDWWLTFDKGILQLEIVEDPRSMFRESAQIHPPLAARFDDEEEWGFVDQLLHEPENSLVRLVYADWLEDRGDDKATILRELDTVLVGIRSGKHKQIVAAEQTLRAWVAAGVDYPWLRLVGAPGLRSTHS